MKHVATAKLKDFFKPLIDSGSVQAAIMVLRPGQSSSDEVTNEHPRSEQWVFVTSGFGQAKVEHRRVQLKAGSLLLIERNERHQITNTGKTPLTTINFYAPPAYTPMANVKPTAKN